MKSPISGIREMSLEPIVRRGATRMAFLLGDVALKFARSPVGARCNLFEADLYLRVDNRRRAMLCPVMACSGNGAVLVQERATQLTLVSRNMLREKNGFPDWDYRGLHDIACPFEWKASDWGYLQSGNLVAIDYSAPALG